MSDSTPNCCKNCEVPTKNTSCPQYANCPAWLTWFHNEWTRIRRAADRIRANNKKGGQQRDRP